MRLAFRVLLLSATALVALTGSVALHGWHGYSEVYSPPGADAADLFFLAQQLPRRPEPTSPLSPERADIVERVLPPHLARSTFIRSSVSIVRRDSVRRRGALFVSEGFVAFGGLHVVAGHATFAAGGTSGQATCAVSARYARETHGSPAAAIGSAVSTPTGSCTVTGVIAAESLDYWMSDVAVVAPLGGEAAFPGYRIADSRRNLSVHFMVRLPTATDRAQTTVAVSRAVTASDDAPLHIVPAAAYLFPAGARRSSEIAFATAAAALTLSLILVFTWLALAGELDSASIRTHAVLGASPRRYFVHVATRAWIPSAAGALLAWSADALLSLSGFCSRDLHSPGSLAIAPAGAWVVTLLGFATSSAARLRSMSGMPLAETRRVRIRGAVPLRLLHLGAPGLLIVAAAYNAAYDRVAAADLGMQPEGATAFELRVRPGTAPGSLRAELEALHREIIAMPGVASAAFASLNPLLHGGLTSSITIENGGRFLNGDPDHVTPGRQVVGPGFAAAVGARMVDGRDLTWAELSLERPVIVNEAAARAYWKDGKALGRRLKFGRATEPEAWARVVGVISNIRHEGLRGTVKPEIYLSFSSDGLNTPSLQLLVRWRDRMDVGVVERSLARRRGPLELAGVMRLAEAADLPVRHLRLARTLVVGITTAAICGYAAGLLLFVLADLSRRRRELAVRYALGASPARLLLAQLRGNLGTAATLSFLGTALGALAVTFISRLDSDIEPVQLLTAAVLAAMSPLLAVATALATTAAYRRASPAEILRAG